MYETFFRDHEDGRVGLEVDSLASFHRLSHKWMISFCWYSMDLLGSPNPLRDLSP